MTSSSYNYIGQTNTNLVCCICRNPYVDPVTSTTCSHTFCKLCIAEALNHSPHCPVDRSVLAAKHLAVSDPIIRAMVDELVVECANKGAGCEFACQRQLLQAHVKDDCQFAQIPCTEKDCDAMVLRKDLQGHKCGKEKSIDLEEPQERYPQESDYCEACNLSQSATGKLPESQVLCSKCTIGCSQSANGCQWSGSRYLLEEHLTSCPYEAIKGFFCLNQAQLQEYQVENQLLKLKLSRMEGVVRVLTHEMQALRGIMAPWCHTDVAPGSESLDSDDILSHSPRQFSPFDLSTAVVSPLTREGDGLEIDAYFPRDSASTPANIAFHLQQPPLASQHQRPQHFRPMSMSNLGSPNGPVWDGITNPASATAVTSVAPLDLSTTLKGTLSGLRESVVIMANSMDSMGRKTEIALNNEMRRVNEEIMSLRAGIHGIRMQMHAMMVDRNTQRLGAQWPLAPSSEGSPSVSTAMGPPFTKL